MDSVLELYETKFDPEDYLDEYYKELDPEVEFFLYNLHKVFEGIYKT